jgi:nitrogen fixation/metabolism regulation signal transduction histidine kinase
VVVGQEVGASLLDTVRQPERIHARILDADGAVLVPPAEPWPTGAADGFRIDLPGTDGDGAPTAIIETAISRADLERVLTQVTAASLVLAAGALVVTIVLGMFVARRMTRDLDRLVEGAQAAARGDLDHRVDVRARDEIGAVANSFNLMMEDLATAKERLVMAERVAAWQEIARRLAHEIKNPLTPIQMAVETLRKSWSKKHPSFDEIFDESTTAVLEESARLKRIVSEFSQFARMPKPDLGPCDLNDLVASCLALYGGSVPVTRHLAADLAPIHADRDQLQQVLLNLLENARDALATMPADHVSQIAVETRPGARPDRVELVVADNGPGIAEPVREKLFTPYFTTKQSHGGTGLGLAIAHRILSDHGGHISLRDSALGGACFCVELPVSTDPPDPGTALAK